MALCVFLPLSACKKNAKKYEPSDVIARIGNETITYALYKAAFDSYANYFKQMGYDPLANESEITGFQDLVINALTSDMVVLYHAKEDGFDISDEEKEEVRKEAAGELEEIKESYMALAAEAASKDSSLTVEQHFTALIAELSLYYTGRSMTFEEYSEEYTNELINSRLIERYKEHVVAGFTVTEAMAANWYSRQYEADESNFTENPGQFKPAMENYERYGASLEIYPPTYAPAGYFRIMDIVVSPEGTLSDEYNTKVARMREIAEECSALLFSNALTGSDSNSDRIKTLLDEYRTLQAETDAIYEEYAASAKQKINAAYQELEAGKPFPEVMLAYTEDTAVIGADGALGCEAFRTKGMLISLTHSSERDWSPTVKEIFSMTEPGSYSGVFTDEDGRMHIIYNAGEVRKGQIPLESIYEDVETIVRQENGDSDWDELLDAWLDDPDLYMDMEAVRSLGKDDVSEPPEAPDLNG